MPELWLEAGTLWDKVKETTEQATRSHALQSIPTDWEIVEDGDVPFLVRVLSSIARKEKAKKQQEKSPKPKNPFLPYEKDLFVTDISPTHLCLLNKFNVVAHHLLVVTRDFEEQENWLNLADFQAMTACLQEIEGLAFYNGGKNAGASQPHKHLQLVPFPLTPHNATIPLEPLLKDTDNTTIPHLPFRHAFTTFPSPPSPETYLDYYQHLLQEVGLLNHEASPTQQTNAYNLLATRNWMLLIPRVQDQFASIPVNSLGFAGTFFVKNEEQLAQLKDYRPFTILKNVAQSER
ncbi:MAG: phosphorylase [Kamptonema sp. SIO4C4]|nr:phosphorylase [Kamptonema sp. SIO4C4]